MAKKTISKIAAVALAGASVVSTMSIAASAAKINTDGKLYGDVYVVTSTITTPSGVKQDVITYYADEDDAKAASSKYTKADVTTIGSTVYVKDGIVYKTKQDDSTAYKTTTTQNAITGSTTHTIPTSHRYSSNTVYYSDETRTWYPNLQSLKAATGNTNYSGTRESNYSSERCWFDPESGNYYTKSLSIAVNNAVFISDGSNTSSSTTTSTNDSTSVYKVNGRYYPNYSSAYSAANGKTSLISWVSDYTTLPTNFFSNVTGKFYSSYASAYAASNADRDDVVVFNDYYYDYYYDYYDYLYGYDYYDYLYGYYGYSDPYYYYWLNRNNGSSSSSSSSSKDTTTATVGNKKGWTNIAKSLKKSSNGSTVTVDMNKETEIPSSVLSAIDGKNVTVKFVLDNGVTFTVNGKDVTSAKDIDLDTTYNTKSISNKLIKAAYKKNDAVSSAQLSIDAGSFGFSTDITVKFNAKRSGYKAKLYRYNASNNSLQLVDSATIGSSGKCTFDNVTKGGEFLVVIYK
ncbi:MAG: hypothetical protein IJZ61_03980 [Oscillospiraceae bacterium]|nr:hypothetical protein [Oscillospiraceae bacterium]